MSFLPRTLADMELEFPPELDHLSASSITMALRCEEQWRQVYVLKKRKPPSLAAITGSADHKAIEISMRQKIVTGEDLPVGDVRDAFVEAIEQRVEESGGLAEVLTEGQTKSDYDHVRTQGQKVVAGYHTLVSPSVQPLDVELEFRHKVIGLPVEILGYIDIVAEALPDPFKVPGDPIQAARLIDRKRAGRSSKAPSPDWQLQAGIYQLAMPYRHDWHVSVTTAVPKYETLTMEVGNSLVTERVLRDAALKIGFLYQRYGPDEPWPATGKAHTWACGYCGFKPDCWGWATTSVV